MIMTNEDLQVYSLEGNELVLTVKFTGFDKDWPTTYVHNGVMYEFVWQEPIPYSWNVAGCAKYLKRV